MRASMPAPAHIGTLINRDSNIQNSDCQVFPRRVTPLSKKVEEITCPVCGKPVGLDVAECPHCGAEFEEDVEETAAEATEEVSCPVCGKSVGLDVVACPHCGAEFEEETIEEVIEVEERQVEQEEEPEEAEVEEAEEAVAAPSNITDLRVIGVALIILGILGSQIALMVDWYWSWVPPIEDNLALFVAMAVVVLVVGLLVFMLVKQLVAGGKSIPGMMPGISLSLFLFGIFALVMVLLWNPINSALQDHQAVVAGVFLLVLVAGIGLMFMGTRTAEKAACD